MQINQYYIDNYLTPGATDYNYIFENCPKEFLDEAFALLSRDTDGIIPCTIRITNKTEQQLSNILSQCKDNFERTIVCRDFIVSLVMEQLLSKAKTDKKLSRISLDTVQSIITSILNGNFEEMKRLHTSAPIPMDIEFSNNKLRRQSEKIEVNFFLEDTSNPHLQKAINNFISSRELYSVKIFTNNERLPSYRDQANNIIEDPHDYVSRNARDFIKDDTQMEM